MSVRVAIADDHRVVAESLQTMLERKDDEIVVVHLAADGSEAIAGAEATRPDVILMDLRMPGLDGVTAIREIMRRLPDTRVVALTTFEDDELVFGALDAGACGYVLKDMTSAELVRCVHQAARGEAPISPRVATKLVRHARRTYHHGEGGAGGSPEDKRSIEGGSKQDGSGSEPTILPTGGTSPDDELTPREIEVLRLVAQGLSTSRIAEELCISVGTVKNHINAIYQILDLHSRAELVLYAVERGIGPAPRGK